MKITKIDVMLFHPIESSNARGKTGAPVSWDNPAWNPVGCRVYTDEGIYGDGEAAMAYGAGCHGAFGMIRDLGNLARTVARCSLRACPHWIWPFGISVVRP